MPMPSNRGHFGRFSPRYRAPEAITTVCALACVPSSSRNRNGRQSQSIPSTHLGSAILAPNFCACNCARPASDCPETPLEKPRSLSIFELVPA